MTTSCLIPCCTRKKVRDARSSLCAILFSDLDDTLLQRRHDSAEFMIFWAQYANEQQAELVYNTGRPCTFVQKLMHDGELPDVDFIIANQGHNIYYKGKLWDPWIRYMQSVNFLLSSVAHTADVLRHLDVTPCSIQIDHHDFFLRWWVKGGSSWNECANIYHRVCDSVPAFPSSRLYKYTPEEIATEFADNNWFEEYGMGCQLQSALIRDSKAPAAQFLYDHISRYCPRRPLAMWAGDGDNDIGMLDTDVLAIVPYNACCGLKRACWQSEGTVRTFLASSNFAQGVIEGLQHFADQH